MLALVRVEYVDAASELYALPLAWITGERPARPGCRGGGDLPADDGTYGALVDATLEAEAVRALLETAFRNQRVGTADRLIGSSVEPDALAALEAEPPGRAAQDGLASGPHDPAVRRSLRAQDRARTSTTESGPELEVSRVPGQARRGHRAPPAGRPGAVAGPLRPPSTVAIAHAFVPSAGTAWHLTLEELGRLLRSRPARERAASRALPYRSSRRSSSRAPSLRGRGRADGRLPRRPRPSSAGASRSCTWRSPAPMATPPSSRSRTPRSTGARSTSRCAISAARCFARCARGFRSLPGAAHAAASDILAREAELHRSFEPLLRARTSGMRIRTHGDLHLGHVLYTGKGFVLTGFNGVRGRDVEERRRKRSPLRDLAWMARLVRASPRSSGCSTPPAFARATWTPRVPGRCTGRRGRLPRS